MLEGIRKLTNYKMYDQQILFIKTLMGNTTSRFCSIKFERFSVNDMISFILTYEANINLLCRMAANVLWIKFK
jgi:hypothetical protein